MTSTGSRLAFESFVNIARATSPGQYEMEGGWNTSRTKVLDNAVVGFMCHHGKVVLG